MSDAKSLAELVGQLRSSGRFAYDSEFIGELTYFPKLCLIQVSTSTHVSLIDPFAPMDLTPFWDLICDASIVKIVHAGEQDIEPVVRHTGRAPANLLDTQVSAGLIGLPYPISLSKLVQEFTGAKLGKGLTFSRWDQRPLSPMQLRYAADDVRYLPAVCAAIESRLDQLQHAGWAHQACAEMCDPSQHVFDPDSQYLRFRGSSSLSQQGLGVLRELTIWRDQAAQADDVPPRTMLRDEVMLEIARHPPRAVERLSRIRGLPRPIQSKYGDQIVERTLRVLSLPADQLPPMQSGEVSPTSRFRAESLWAAAQSICTGRSIDPALITSRAEIGELHRRLESNQAVDDMRVTKNWRGEILGQRLIQLMRGDAGFIGSWHDGALRVQERRANSA